MKNTRKIIFRILALAIGTIPIVVLFAVFSKNLIKGLTVGAVKG